MSQIILPSRWTRQPQWPVQISGSLSDDLIFLWAYRQDPQNRELIRKEVVPTPSAALTTSATDKGMGVSAASGKPLVYPKEYLNVGTGSFTVFALANPAPETTKRALISQDYPAAGQFYLIANCDTGYAADSGRLMFGTDSGGGTGSLISAAGVIDGRAHLFVGVRDGSRHAIYVDGVLAAQQTLTAIDINTMGSAGVGIGCLYGYSGYDAIHTTLIAGMYQRALSGDEIQRLPWQIFKRKSRVLYFETAGGGTVDLEGAAAAQASSAAALDQAVHPAGTASAAASAFAALAVEIPIAAAAAIAATATGALALTLPLGGSAGAAAAAQAALTQQVPADDMSGAYGDCAYGACPYGGGTEAYTGVALAGAASAVADGQGGLALSIPLAGAAVAAAVASAAAALGTPLAGSAAGTAGAAGTLNLAVSLSGAALAQALAAAGLTVEAPGEVALSGTAAAAASAAGALALEIPVSGAAVTVAGAAGGLTHIVPLAGAAAVAVSATGGLDVTAAAVQLSAAALAAAESGGVLTLRVSLSGAGLAQALAAGALTTQPSITAGMLTRVVRAGAGAWTAQAAAGPWQVAAAA